MPADPSLLLTHEDRISKIEEKQSDMKSDLAVLDQKVETGFSTTEATLKSYKPALAKIYEVSEQVASMANKQKARKERWESFWKYTWAVVLVVLGALAKHLFDHLTK